MGKGYRVDTYDRLLDIKEQDIEDWKECCPYCQSKNLYIHPIGVAFRQHTITDFSDLHEDVRKYYYDLPNISEAVMRCVEGERGTRVSIQCLDCRTQMNTFMNKKPDFGVQKVKVNKQRLKKYLDGFYGVTEVMRLG